MVSAFHSYNICRTAPGGPFNIRPIATGHVKTDNQKQTIS